MATLSARTERFSSLAHLRIVARRSASVEGRI